ncbi:MAG TPA: hypothetical protein EYP80_01115 [Candidatus Aenigmarchaeota archaeon]|nr:hypothetical protein [Candidatus Aenigmarchaeota archaeon]
MRISRRDFLKLGGSVLAMLSIGKVSADKEIFEKIFGKSPNDPEDPTDDTLYFFNIRDLRNHFYEFDGFNKIEKDINEPIRDPDEITNELIRKTYRTAKHGMYILAHRSIDVSPTDFAVWLALSSKKTVTILPYLVYVDTDGDGKPEELAALYCPHAGFEEKRLKEIKEHLKPWPEANYSDYPGFYNYCVNPFDWKKAENNKKFDPLQKLLYWENPGSVNVLIKSPKNNKEFEKTTIYPEECIGKTPAEIRLDKYDFKSEYGKTPSSKPYIKEYSQKAEEVPGFEIFAGLAGLGLAALNKRK